MIDIDIRKKQGGFAVAASFKQDQSGVTALFGPSGSGKTSVVNMVAGLLRPDTGRIVINSRCLFDSDRHVDLAPERRRIGYVFQDGRLFPHLTVRANLTYGMNRVPSQERFVTFDQVVDLLGLAPLLHRRPAKLSGGEKQRVAIGRALLTSPALLLMDEPLASLDASRKSEVLPFIQGLSTQFDMPILYVSHAIDEILNLATNLVILDTGRIVATGGIEELMGRLDLQSPGSPNDIGAVIRARVAQERDAYGLTHLRFAGGVLKMHCPGSLKDAAIRIQIPAHQVAISLEPPRQSSFQNIFSGLIEDIESREGPFVDLRMNIGCPLLARITARACADLNLACGQRVFALVKSVSVLH